MGEAVSAEMLRQLVEYDPETGVFLWRERPAELFAPGRWGTRKESAAIWNSQNAGARAMNTKNVQGYLVGSIFGQQIKAHRAAWCMAYGDWPPSMIDHINRDRSDNRLRNLRLAGSVLNGRNRDMLERNKSGVTGVWRKPDGRWSATIWNNGRQLHIGVFSTLQAAAEARWAAERKFGYEATHGRRL